MKRSIKSKTVSFVVSVALLASMLCIGLPSQAAEMSDYVVTELDSDGTATAVNTINKINVAKNVSHQVLNADRTENAKTSGKYYYVTDGVIPGIVGETEATESTGFCFIAYSENYIEIDFGGVATVEEILLAGTKTSSVDGLENALGTATIFLGNDVTTLYTEPVWKATVEVDAAAIIDLDQPVNANYAAVQVTSDYDALFSELGFYSSQPVEVTRDTYTVEKINYSATLNNLEKKNNLNALYDGILSYKPFTDIVLGATNLLGDATAAVAYKDEGLTQKDNTVNNPSYLVDGIVDGVTCAEGISDRMAGWSYSTATYLYYDLRDVYEIQSLFAAGSAGQCASWGFNFGKMTVYMSDSYDGLVTEANKVFEETDLTVGALLTLHEPKAARYVVVMLQGDSYARLSELSINGTLRGTVKDELEPARTIETIGTQIRTDGNTLPAGAGTVDLRFVSTLRCTGVVLKDGVGDYTAATVTVDGTAYPIIGVGTMVGRESVISRACLQLKDAMDYEGAKVMDVPAKNIYSQAEDNTSITYTAVVVNVPYNLYGEDICACAYVRYETPDGEKVLYGNIVVRNVYDTWAADAPAEREVLNRADYLNDGTGYFKQGSRVVFLGDSITNDGTFVAQIFKYYAARYPDDRVEMYMAGSRGDTAGDGFPYLEDRVLAFNPDYVSIMYGMNDIRREGYTKGYDAASAQQKSYIDTYTANVEKIIQYLQAKGIKIILCTPTPFDETCTGKSGNYPGCAKALQLCAEKAGALAEKYNCALVDFNTPMSEAISYMQDADNGGSTTYTLIDDRIHPGTAGHDMMARIWLKTLGENVTVPDNATLLNCIKGTATVNTTFRDVSVDFGIKVMSVSANGIIGSTNRNICSYWECELFYITPEEYTTLTTWEERIASVAANTRWKDWRADLKKNYATHLTKLGLYRYTVQRDVRKVYGIYD